MARISVILLVLCLSGCPTPVNYYSENPQSEATAQELDKLRAIEIARREIDANDPEVGDAVFKATRSDSGWRVVATARAERITVKISDSGEIVAYKKE